jgi:hypothetical protein
MPVVFVRGKQKAWSIPKEKETKIPKFKVKYDLQKPKLGNKSVSTQTSMEIYDVARVVEPPSGYTLGAAPAARIPELIPESPVSNISTIPSPIQNILQEFPPNPIVTGVWNQQGTPQFEMIPESPESRNPIVPGVWDRIGTPQFENIPESPNSLITKKWDMLRPKFKKR